MGFFDGVHRGHARVLKAARRPGAAHGVLTFENHPLTVLRPGDAPPLIVPDTAVKERLIRELGAEVLLSLPFSPELASWTAPEFLGRLCAACRCVHVAVGGNWRFGAGRAGDAAFLETEGSRLGFAVTRVPLKTSRGEVICSSAIRRHLSENRFARALELLGHPLWMSGTVTAGRRLARRWGFPTANVAVKSGVLPPFGVYAVRVHTGGRSRPGIANFGIRPTVDRQPSAPILEAHLFDFAEDLYGARLEVELLRLLRRERSFPGQDALRRQIACDAAEARRFFSSRPDAADAGSVSH